VSSLPFPFVSTEKSICPVAEIIILVLYITADPNTVIFDGRLNSWIRSFFSVVVALNIITTGLMGYRLWSTHQKSSRYNTEKSKIISVLRIFLESAALQLVTQIILLILYSMHNNAQNLLLQSSVPIVVSWKDLRPIHFSHVLLGHNIQCYCHPNQTASHRHPARD